MNNYNIKRQLGNGAQGTVHLVEDKATKELCVVKKMECDDEAEAGKAFNEAVALKKLQHPYICGYKEFFVVWEPKEAAIHVCIVMDYYKLGDLDLALKSRNARGEMLEEHVLMKWVGQILEGLVYVHEQKLIHRDLKPSNIFLKDDMSLAIGDFGVSTVGNSKAVTRTTVGSINWMAPEVLLDVKPRYDERSDVWSLGCIVLVMALCGLKDDEETSILLFDLKTNLQVLEDVLDLVKERYTLELCQFLRVTLCRNYEQRPSSLDLVELPYMQKCLSLNGSVLFNELADVGGSEVQLLPTTGGADPVIAYMCANGRREECQCLALKQLLQMDQINIDDTGKKRVVTTMASFKSSLQVQTLCCQLLANIVATVDLQEGDILFTEEFVKPICTAMRSHASSRDLFSSASTLLMVLSSDESAADVIGRLGGIQDLISAMHTFPSDLEMVSDCCTAMWSLAVIDNNLKIMTKEKCVRDVFVAMEMHVESRDLIEAASSAMCSLASVDDNLYVMAEMNTVDFFLQIIQKHGEDACIVKLICCTLCSLVKVHEASAFHLLQTDSGVNGMTIIMKVLGFFSSDMDVVEAIVNLIDSMAEYECVRHELLSLKVHDILEKLNQTLSADQKKSGVCDVIVKVLQTLVPSRVDKKE